MNSIVAQMMGTCTNRAERQSPPCKSKGIVRVRTGTDGMAKSTAKPDKRTLPFAEMELFEEQVTQQKAKR